MMGGNLSHEFMLLTPAGEDSIVLCPSCGHRANMEAAECITEAPSEGICASEGRTDGHTECAASSLPLPALTEVSTPGVHTIDELCAFLGITAAQCCKAVVYQRNRDDSYVVLFIRGDLDVNETKLTNRLREEVHPGEITEGSGLQAGFIGPAALYAGLRKSSGENTGLTILFDRSLKGATGLVCGANRADFHYTGLCMERDCPDASYEDFAKAQEGGICPVCGRHSLTISRGIEVGNIFQLGTKYSKAMHMQYVDADGAAHYPLMGCYGIGIGRLAASVCEAHHDEYGPIWPITISPWQVHLCCMRSDNAEVHAMADALYDELQRAGVEVLYDDRNVSAGVMFSDADLLGIPIRLIASPRNRKEGCVEMTLRGNKADTCKIPADEIVLRVREKISALTAALQPE